MRVRTAILALGLLALPAGAFAQTSSGSSTSTAAAVPATWTAEIKDAFFSNAEATAFRAAPDISERFQGMPPEQQEIVRNDCKTILGSGTDAGLAVDPENPQSTEQSAMAESGDAEITSMNGLCTLLLES